MKRWILVLLAIFLLSFAAWGRAKEHDPLAGVQPGPDGKIDVVAIFPHQDDETIFVGGTLLTVKKDPRVRTHVVCFTLGDLSSAKDYLRISGEELARIRVQELRSATTDLRVDELIQLEHPDQGLPKLAPETLAEEAREMIERTGAEVVITYGPDGMTGHVDHRALSAAVTAAFPQTPAQRLYYVSLPRFWARLVPNEARMLPAPATLKVNIRPVKKLKGLALCAHASQKFYSGWMLNVSMKNLFEHEWFALAAEKQ